MTRRTSDVAVCCSNDSDSSLASRAAFASSPAADEPRGRAVPIPLGRFGAAGLRRRDLVEPALERRFMAFPEALPTQATGLWATMQALCDLPTTLNMDGGRGRLMSALPPKADIGTQSRNVRFVPKADERQCSKSSLFDDPVGAAG